MRDRSSSFSDISNSNVPLKRSDSSSRLQNQNASNDSQVDQFIEEKRSILTLAKIIRTLRDDPNSLYEVIEPKKKLCDMINALPVKVYADIITVQDKLFDRDRLLDILLSENVNSDYRVMALENAPNRGGVYLAEDYILAKNYAALDALIEDDRISIKYVATLFVRCRREEKAEPFTDAIAAKSAVDTLRDLTKKYDITNNASSKTNVRVGQFYLAYNKLSGSAAKLGLFAATNRLAIDVHEIEEQYACVSGQTY